MELRYIVYQQRRETTICNELIYNTCLENASYLGKYSYHISNSILSNGMKTYERDSSFLFKRISSTKTVYIHN